MLVLAIFIEARFNRGNVMFSALDISYKTIGLLKDDSALGSDLTPLKLQKLLFYMQGWYAANHKERLFSDDIYAWDLGPVVEDVYHYFKTFGSRDLLKQELPEHQIIDGDKTDVEADLKDVLKVYGHMSAYELVARTHEEIVWRKNFKASNKVIPFEEIRKAFESRLVGAAD